MTNKHTSSRAPFPRRQPAALRDLPRPLPLPLPPLLDQPVDGDPSVVHMYALFLCGAGG